MSSRSAHKRTKFRCLPGDVWKGVKIAMLEGESTPRAKSYRKLIQKKANRRTRYKKIP
jgi:hypothetical protein